MAISSIGNYNSGLQTPQKIYKPYFKYIDGDIYRLNDIDFSGNINLIKWNDTLNQFDIMYSGNYSFTDGGINYTVVGIKEIDWLKTDGTSGSLMGYYLIVEATDGGGNSKFFMFRTTDLSNPFQSLVTFSGLTNNDLSSIISNKLGINISYPVGLKMFRSLPDSGSNIHYYFALKVADTDLFDQDVIIVGELNSGNPNEMIAINYESTSSNVTNVLAYEIDANNNKIVADYNDDIFEINYTLLRFTDNRLLQIERTKKRFSKDLSSTYTIASDITTIVDISNTTHASEFIDNYEDFINFYDTVKIANEYSTNRSWIISVPFVSSSLDGVDDIYTAISFNKTKIYKYVDHILQPDSNDQTITGNILVSTKNIITLWHLQNKESITSYSYILSSCSSSGNTIRYVVFYPPDKIRIYEGDISIGGNLDVNFNAYIDEQQVTLNTGEYIIGGSIIKTPAGKFIFLLSKNS